MEEPLTPSAAAPPGPPWWSWHSAPSRAPPWALSGPWIFSQAWRKVTRGDQWEAAPGLSKAPPKVRLGSHAAALLALPSSRAAPAPSPRNPHLAHSRPVQAFSVTVHPDSNFLLLRIPVCVRKRARNGQGVNTRVPGPAQRPAYPSLCACLKPPKSHPRAPLFPSAKTS